MQTWNTRSETTIPTKISNFTCERIGDEGEKRIGAEGEERISIVEEDDAIFAAGKREERETPFTQTS